MFITRSFTSAAAGLALVAVLAACAQQPAGTPSQTVAPSPTQQPSQAPADEPSTEPSPDETPEPIPTEVVRFDLPMIGRVTVGGLDVHSLPSLESPLLTGEGSGDVQLALDDFVIVTLGPVVNDGASWYEVRALPDESAYFEFGWVPGESLTRESDLPAGQAIVTTISGQGSGAAASADVLLGTPTTVRFAAAPMPDRDSCEIEVTLTRTDGLAVNVATNTVTEAEAFMLSANELSSLFMEEAGQITLQVKSNCTFAANVTTPPQ